MSMAELLDAIAEMSSEEIRMLCAAIQRRFSAALPESGPEEDDPGRFMRYESVCNVILADSGPDEVQAVREVRRIRDCSLKEGINIVRNPPQTIKENCGWEEGFEIKRRFEAFGAAVELERDSRKIFDYANSQDGCAYD